MARQAVGLRSFVAWSPRSLRQLARELDLQRAFAKLDMILMVDACYRSTVDPIEQMKQGQHWAQRACWKAGRGSNKAASLEMWFLTQLLPKAKLHHTITGPAAGIRKPD